MVRARVSPSRSWITNQAPTAVVVGDLHDHVKAASSAGWRTSSAVSTSVRGAQMARPAARLNSATNVWICLLGRFLQGAWATGGRAGPAT